MMPAHSSIEWTGPTWNPVDGGHCQASEGCQRCYANTFASRFEGVPGHPFEHGFDLRFWPERLREPWRWMTSELVFTCSMSDLFGPKVPNAYIARVWLTMGWTGPLGHGAACRAHRGIQTYQVLTKRPGRLAAFLRGWADLDQRRAWIDAVGDAPELQRLGADYDRYAPLVWPDALPNVWVGTSVETQRWAEVRIPALLRCPAAVRFLSVEPLLGPVDLAKWLTGSQLDQVIVGGESGGHARPMHPQWARTIRDQAASTGTAFLFKQWGAWAPCEEPPRRRDTWVYATHDRAPVRDGRMPAGVVHMRWRGKGRAGRLLDGQVHDALPAGWSIQTVRGRRRPQPPAAPANVAIPPLRAAPRLTLHPPATRAAAAGLSAHGDRATVPGGGAGRS